MARRLLRYNEDPILRKISKPIKEITPRIKDLSKDMHETLLDSNGVGLSAVQIGILKRLVVIDFGDDETYGEYFVDGPIIAINPELVDEEGEIVESEACLSFPALSGEVKRPAKIKVKYTNLDGEEVIGEYEGMMARCFCHEMDHLDGKVFIDRVEEGTLKNEAEA